MSDATHFTLLLLPSVSATVLPLLDSACTEVSGDSDRSAASRFANIISPYSSSGNSKGQYSDSSDSSPSAVIIESSYTPVNTKGLKY
jgi:hypothetical protein